MDPESSDQSVLLPGGDPPSPSPLRVRPERIPARLAEIPAWVLWNYQLIDDCHGNRRWAKPPVDTDRRPINALDPASWLTFEQACHCYRAGGFDGIGISLGRNTPPGRGNAPSVTTADLIGWDIDHARSDEDADRRAREMITRLGGYAELSPSACGYRVLGLGRLPAGRRKHTGFGIECYDGDRYLTVTGHHLEGTPADLIDLTESSARLHAELFPAPRDSHLPPHRRLAATLDGLMTRRLERARHARNGEKFVRLFDRGDRSGYPSDSEADQALCNLLAFWLDGNFEAIEAAWLASALGRRPKVRDRSDYRVRTIEKAVADTPKFFDGGAGPGAYELDDATLAAQAEDARATPQAAHILTTIRDDGADRAALAGITMRGEDTPEIAGESPDADADAIPRPGAPDRLEPEVTPASHPTPGKPLLTDLGNAQRLARSHRDRFCYVPGWRAWRVFDGRCWRADAQLSIQQAAKSTIKGLYAEASAADSVAERKQLASFAVRSERAERIRAMITLAQGELAVTPEVFDRDPDLLNVANGLLNLQTGRLQPHDPGAFQTRLAPASYDPEARSPLWQALLHRVFDEDQELIAYLQVLLGYGITGRVDEEILAIFHGDGSNGKSTVIAGLTAALGDYTTVVEPQVLMQRSRAVHPTDKATFFSQRLVIASEPSGDCQLDESRVKELTSTDRISCRRMKEDFWSYEPTHLTILSTNHLPVVRGTDEGVWRRLRLVPFATTIPAGERDPTYKERLRSERDGILAWLVAGAVRYFAEGLPTASPVERATARYRADCDTLGQFLDECCECGPGHREGANALYQRYKAWMQQNGHEPCNTKAFAAELMKKGFERSNDSRNCRVYRGIRLKREPAGAVDLGSVPSSAVPS